jgi:hypothetical protein
MIIKKLPFNNEHTEELKDKGQLEFSVELPQGENKTLYKILLTHNSIDGKIYISVFNSDVQILFDEKLVTNREIISHSHLWFDGHIKCNGSVDTDIHTLFNDVELQFVID